MDLGFALLLTNHHEQTLPLMLDSERNQQVSILALQRCFKYSEYLLRFSVIDWAGYYSQATLPPVYTRATG